MNSGTSLAHLLPQLQRIISRILHLLNETFLLTLCLFDSLKSFWDTYFNTLKKVLHSSQLHSSPATHNTRRNVTRNTQSLILIWSHIAQPCRWVLVEVFAVVCSNSICASDRISMWNSCGHKKNLEANANDHCLSQGEVEPLTCLCV